MIDSLAQQFVAGWDGHDVNLMKDALAWGFEVEDMEEDDLFFFHFSDGSIAGYRTEPSKQLWVSKQDRLDTLEK